MPTLPTTLDTGPYEAKLSPSDQTVPVSAFFTDIETGSYTVCVGSTCKDARVDAPTQDNEVFSLSAKDATALTQANATSSDDKKTCGSVVSGVGWIICPVIAAITGANDAMWNLVSGLLNVNPLSQSSDLYTAWGDIRNIANVVFVMIFLVTIFSQLSSVGITNYGVKKILPRLVIGAILVNISFIIVQVAVDFANIIGASLYNILYSISPKDFLKLTWAGLPGMILSSIGATAAGAGALALAGGAAAAFWMLLPLAAMGLLSLIAALLTLIFRQAVIPILAIIAPLAFIAYLLPNTEPWFKKWRSLLMSMLILYPMAAVVFGGAQLAARLIIGEGGWWNTLIGVIVMTLPLFSLPFLATKSGAIVSAANGALKGLAEKARKPITNAAKTREDAARADYLANGPRTRLGQAMERNRFGRAIGGAPRRLARNMAARKLTLEQDTDTDKQEFKSQWGKSATGNMGQGKVAENRNGGGGNQAIQRSLGAKTKTETDTHEHGSQFARSTDGKTAIDRLSAAKGESSIDTNTAQTRFANSTEGRRINERISEGSLQNSRDSEDTSHRVAESATGQVLHQKLGESKLQTETDQNNTAIRLEENAPANLMMGAKASELELNAAKAATKQLVTEATTTQGAANLSGMVDSQILTTLQDSQRALDVATLATSSADRVSKQQFNTELAEGGQLATDVAGIDTVYGIPRAQASATAAIARTRSENVAAAGTLFGEQGYSSDELVEVSRGLLRDGNTASIEQQEAAAAEIVKRGYEPDIAKLIDYAGSLVPRDANGKVIKDVNGKVVQATGNAAQFQKALGNMLATSSGRPKYIPGGKLGDLQTATFTDNSDDLVVKTMNDKKVSRTTIAGMSVEEMRKIRETIEARDQETNANKGNPDYDTDRIINDDSKIELGAAILESLNDPRINSSLAANQIEELNKILDELNMQI
jgi:hypothetical protein